MSNDDLFIHIEKLQGGIPWGRVLDAGTGVHSLEWVAGLPSASWTAVTLDAGEAETLAQRLRPRSRPGDRVLAGDWKDPAFLAGEIFETVLCDYLLGALDRFSPYWQEEFFPRLRPHCRPDGAGRLHAVGLEPYPEKDPSAAGRLVLEIARLRDAAILLAGDRCHREYPLDWTVRALEKAGFAIEEAVRFPIVYGPSFIKGQLETALGKLPRIPSRSLARELEKAAKDLREKALAHSEAEKGLRFGEDYVITAKRNTA